MVTYTIRYDGRTYAEKVSAGEVRSMLLQALADEGYTEAQLPPTESAIPALVGWLDGVSEDAANGLSMLPMTSWGRVSIERSSEPYA